MRVRAIVARQPSRPFPVDIVDRTDPAAHQFPAALPPRVGAAFDGGADDVGSIRSAVVANCITTVCCGPGPARAANDLSLTTGFHGVH